MYEEESPTAESLASRSKTDPFLAMKMASKRGSNSGGTGAGEGATSLRAKVDSPDRRYTASDEHNSTVPDDPHRRFTATTQDEHGGMRRVASSGYAIKKKYHNGHQHSRGTPASPSSGSLGPASSISSNSSTGSASLIASSSRKRKPTVMPRILSDADKIVGNYILGESIGKGGAGVVYRGTHKDTGALVAVKRVNLRGLQLAEVEALELEFKLLRNLTHPHIVSYVEAIRKNGFLHIVLEYMDNGSLNQYMKTHARSSQSETLEKKVAQYTYGVLRGLQYLHHRGVVHRDIKGANILTDTNGNVKLADFGVATQVMGEIGEEAVGTPYWMAPEVIQMSPHTSSCDIWSLGCTIIELITGSPPYYDINPMAAMYRIVQQGITPPASFSTDLQDFLTHCFQREATKRWDAEALLKHIWLKDVVKDPPGWDSQRVALRRCDIPGCDNVALGNGTLCAAHQTDETPTSPPPLTEQQSFDQLAYAKQISMIQAQLHNPKGTLHKKQATLRMAAKMKGNPDHGGSVGSTDEKSPHGHNGGGGGHHGQSASSGDTGQFSISEWDTASSSGASSIRSDISVGSLNSSSNLGSSPSPLVGPMESGSSALDVAMYSMSISDNRGPQQQQQQPDAATLLAQAQQQEKERAQRLLLEQQEQALREAAAERERASQAAVAAAAAAAVAAQQQAADAASKAAAASAAAAATAAAEKQRQLQFELDKKEDEERLAREQEERKRQWMNRVKERMLRKEGTAFVKNGRRGNPHTRTIKILPNGMLSWSTGQIALTSITDVEPGKRTDVFSRNKTTDPEKCFSVITADRTLDLEAENKQQRDEWVEGLKRIVQEEREKRKTPEKKKK